MADLIQLARTTAENWEKNSDRPDTIPLSGHRQKFESPAHDRYLRARARKSTDGRYTIVPFPRKNSNCREAREHGAERERSRPALIDANRSRGESTVRLMPERRPLSERERVAVHQMMGLIYDYRSQNPRDNAWRRGHARAAND